MATPSLKSAELNGYRFHVFLSYKRGRKDEHGRTRDDDVEIWVREFFEPELQRKLTHKVNASAEIFLDTVGIRTGETYSCTLVKALRTARCLVPIWSPMYFRSLWCVSEWITFSKRSRSLVVPVLFQGRRAFPEAARAIQYQDFSKFAYTSRSFQQSLKYLEFEDLVEKLARHIAKTLTKAPDYDPTWPVVVPETEITDAVANLKVTSLEGLPNVDEFYVEEKPRIGRLTLRAA